MLPPIAAVTHKIRVEAMTTLPYEQRETVILRVQGEMKFSTIAAMQETSVKTVMSRYRYGITKLRSLLNSEEIA